jgi:phosphoglycerol transferase MdoB-like AlkP superfamily enzyme
MFYSVHVASGGQLQSILSFIESRQGLWGPLVLLLVLALIFAFRKNLTIIQTSIIVVSAVSMTSAISYYYYIVIAIPFLLTLHKASKSNSELMTKVKQYGSQETRNRKIDFALWAASILTLVQFPVLIAQESEYTITTAPFIGGVWIFCHLYIFVVNVRSSEKSQIPKDK